MEKCLIALAWTSDSGYIGILYGIELTTSMQCCRDVCIRACMYVCAVFGSKTTSCGVPHEVAQVMEGLQVFRLMS